MCTGHCVLPQVPLLPLLPLLLLGELWDSSCEVEKGKLFLVSTIE
jgi:hypothetical protein